MIKNLILTLILSLLLISCIKENPDLVNPPSRAETVNVRFVNLAGSDENRVLVWERSLESDVTPFGESSPAINPPGDSSSIVQVKRGNITEYEAPIRIPNYIRNANYTFYAIPTRNGIANPKRVDTVIVMNTSTAIPDVTDNAYIRMFSGVPDSTISYALRLGCPSGQYILNYTGFGQRTGRAFEVRAGELVVSLVKRVQGGTGEELVNLYQVDLEKKGQYTFVIKPTDDGEELLLLDEMNLSSEALSEPAIVTQRLTDFRVVNMSQSQVDIDANGEGNFINGLAFEQISPYIEIPACGSEFSDLINVSSGGNVTATDSVSLVVKNRYTMFVLDSDLGEATRTVIVPPSMINEPTDQAASVRVINGAINSDELAVSIAGRDGTNPGELISGIRIANNLKFGDLSESRLVPTGKTPLSIFTAYAPAKLLFSASYEFEPNKSYIVLIGEDGPENYKLSIIEEDEGASMVDYLNDGMLVQVLNLISDREEIEFSSGEGTITNGILQFSQSIVTVLERGQNTLNINGKSYPLNADPAITGFIIAYGTNDNFEIYDFSAQSMGDARNTYRRRVINLSDIELLGVRDILRDPDKNLLPAFTVVESMTASNPNSVDRERRITLYFFDEANIPDDPEYDGIFTLTDISFNFGINYSIIFFGENEEYGTLIQQEY